MEIGDMNLRIISLNLQIISEDIHECYYREAIQIGVQQTVDELKYMICKNFEIDVESISNNFTELRSGTIYQCGLNNGDTVTAHEKLRQISNVYLCKVSSLIEQSNIFFSNLESVSNFKQRTVKVLALNQSVDSIVLFSNFETIDNDKYVQNVVLLEDNKLMRDYEDVHKSIVGYILISELGDQIQLGCKIHQGSFSTVCKANNGKYAIKKYVAVEQTYKKIWRELFACERFKDKSRIIQLISYHKDDSYFYIVMEYMEGGSIYEYVQKNGAVAIDLIGKWAKQILEGLVYLHGERVIHCDLKTSCILLDENRNIKISGFDMAKYMLGQTSLSLYDGTVTSKPGVYNYMAPEIIDRRLASPKSDIWSFGAILVELITGQVPFPGMAQMSVCQQIYKYKRIPFKHPEETPLDLQKLIQICLRENYKEREDAAKLLENDFFSNL